MRAGARMHFEYIRREYLKRKLFYVTIRMIRRLRDPYYQGAAAEMGFYFIFSIIPLLTLLLQMLTFFDLTERLYESMFMRFEGNEMATYVLSAVQDALSNGSFSIAFILVALWGASKIIFSMIRMANYTYRVGDVKRNSYVRSRARSVVTVAMLILMIVATLVVFVYGNSLVRLANAVLQEFLNITFNADWLFSALRWPIALAIYGMFLAVTYKLLPGKRISMKHTVPGSVFAAVGIVVITAGYSIYLKYFSNFNVVYGSLGAVIALLLWFYLVSYILMLGMVINAVWFEEDLWE